jgi:ATP-binding cassette subfamily A (ABC1) protein 3
MSEVTAGFSPLQMRAVRKIDNASAIPLACPQNFNGVSECYGAIVFNSISTTESGRAVVRYTIRSDIGLFYINVEDHTSDFEKRVLPLQWAVDQVICPPNHLQQNSLLTET